MVSTYASPAVSYISRGIQTGGAIPVTPSYVIGSKVKYFRKEMNISRRNGSNFESRLMIRKLGEV